MNWWNRNKITPEQQGMAEKMAMFDAMEDKHKEYISKLKTKIKSKEKLKKEINIYFKNDLEKIKNNWIETNITKDEVIKWNKKWNKEMLEQI